MLTFLAIRDFALIENVEIEFYEGLNILTGETGAGKTVLVGAIGLLLGDRADSLQVRKGAEEATFSCVFDLEALEDVRVRLEDLGYVEAGEQELVLGRMLSAKGKSRCTINGRLSPVSALSRIGELLVDFHGQHEHQALLKSASHLEYLDRFAGSRHQKNVSEYQAHYRHLRSLLKEREEAGASGQRVHKEIELLLAEVREIEKVAPEPGEIESLEREAERMRHSRELWELASRARATLGGDESSAVTVRELLGQVAGDARRMVSRDAGLEGLSSRIESLAYEVDDASASIGAYLEKLETDPARLEEVEGRLSALRTLARKYGGSLEAVAGYLDQAREKVELLQRGIERLEVIEREIAEERRESTGLARGLTEARKKAAGELEKAVLREMAQLELSGASLVVSMESRTGGEGAEDDSWMGPKGADSVEFMFSPEGDEAKPLRKIASGGEMSRVMLALKIVLAGADRIPVLVFDEVDAGIGGETAGKVGEKLFELTRHHQVFCITHLTQIATMADWHFRVEKSMGKGGSRTQIGLLDEEGRVDEVCRMLGDSSGRKVTREHAEDILERARAKKGSG